MLLPSANLALETTQEVCEKLGPAYCAYIVQPNTVLTLANCRLYADGVFYSPSAAIRTRWKKELEITLQEVCTARSMAYHIEDTKNPAGEALLGYDLLNPAGLESTIDDYSFFTAAEKKMLLSGAGSFNIMKQMLSLLQQKPAFKQWKTEDIQHIISGVLLGYPEKAILGSVELWQLEGDDTFIERPISADIRGADYYSCPQPVYDYPRRLTNDPTIRQHEKLWTNILKTFYSSDLHKSLANNAAFSKKIRALSKY